MARPRGFSRGTASRPRRLTSWAVGPGGNAATALSATGEAVLGSGIVLNTEDKSTIVRLRGFCEVVLEAVANIGEGFHCAIGVGLVTTQAFAIGSTAMPDPLDDVFWDGWMYHRFFDLHASTATISDGVNTGRIAWEVDSKAMRKWGANEVLAAKVSGIEIGTAQIEVFFDSRVLIKLG